LKKCTFEPLEEQKCSRLYVDLNPDLKNIFNPAKRIGQINTN
jgi:hypothetical protein